MGKQVKTPRFYVDMPTFLHATGQLGWDDIHGGAELLYMNCANPYTDTRVDTNAQSTLFKIGSSDNNTPKTSFPINFCESSRLSVPFICAIIVFDCSRPFITSIS